MYGRLPTHSALLVFEFCSVKYDYSRKNQINFMTRIIVFFRILQFSYCYFNCIQPWAQYTVLGKKKFSMKWYIFNTYQNYLLITELKESGTFAIPCPLKSQKQRINQTMTFIKEVRISKFKCWKFQFKSILNSV